MLHIDLPLFFCYKIQSQQIGKIPARTRSNARGMFSIC